MRGGDGGREGGKVEIRREKEEGEKDGEVERGCEKVKGMIYCISTSPVT